jgi:serine/threonine protein phosphatase PrpC
VTAQRIACPRCSTTSGDADRFCGHCGAPLADIHSVAIPRSAPEQPCTADRDEVQLATIALITDRGLEHSRNEDAAAAGKLAGNGRGHAIAVAVCDGVSSSSDSYRAAAAASKAGVDGMLSALERSDDAHSAVLAGLAEAARAAAAVQDGRWTGTDESLGPACTYTAAAVVPTADGAVQITVGNVGDSRVYWIPDAPAAAEQLTTDDSVAQELLDASFSADSDAVQRGAHTLSRWLGAEADDTPWSESSVRAITTAGPGSLLLCTDGLWNYLPGAADVAKFFNGADPAETARALVEYALTAGGQDNITVAVIPIGRSR